MSPFKNKTLATFYAIFLGTFGAHRFYLNGAGGWLAWMYPIWFLGAGALALRYLLVLHPDLGTDFISFVHPALLLAFLPTLVGMAEGLYFALTPDAHWDDMHNAGSARKSDSGGLVIAMAVLALGLAATGLLSLIAITVEGYVEGTL